jgi:hypothetical protein
VSPRWRDSWAPVWSTLARLLDAGLVLADAWVIGELALGRLRRRDEVLGLLHRLPQATVATPTEVLTLVEAHWLHWIGIGYVDAQLLAATKLTGPARLWEQRSAPHGSGIPHWLRLRRRPSGRARDIADPERARRLSRHDGQRETQR